VNGAGHVSFALASRGDVKVEVLDVAGRRIASQAWPALEAGSHVKPIPAAASLKPGLYVLRLVTREGTQARRFVTAQ